MNIIGIKGMKMPKNCHECPFIFSDHGDNFWFCSYLYNTVQDRCDLWEERLKVSCKERPEQCPLFEISGNGLDWLEAINKLSGGYNG